MEVVYYYDEMLKISPVKKYFEKYLIYLNDSDFEIRKKQRVLSDIDAKINYIKNQNGLPIPPIAKPLHGYNFFEILSTKDSKILIRILYFRYNDKMVLLHCFEKPFYYKSKKEKNNVKKQNDIAQINLNIFKLKPYNYEKYE
jgi:phage-related protein